MVEKMHSAGSNPSQPNAEDGLPDFPVFDQPQRERPRGPVNWAAAQRNFEPLLRYYRKHHDSPEKRLRSKNPEPFRMD